MVVALFVWGVSNMGRPRPNMTPSREQKVGQWPSQRRMKPPIFHAFSLLFHEREMSLFFANIVTYRTKYLDDRNISLLLLFTLLQNIPFQRSEGNTNIFLLFVHVNEQNICLSVSVRPQCLLPLLLVVRVEAAAALAAASSTRFLSSAAEYPT